MNILVVGEYYEQTNEVQAGCRNVVELHGTNSLVTCMTCSFSIPRVTFQVKRDAVMYQPFFALQRRLEELNPAMETLASEQMMKPDGDVELAPEEVENFRCADDYVTMDMMGQEPEVMANRAGWIF